MSNYRVEKVEILKKRNGEDYIRLNIGDKLVSFFNENDIQQNVKEGDIISCNIKQKDTFYNGYNLQIINSVSAETTIDQDIVIESKQRAPDSVLYAGGITYYFDVKIAKNGTKYLIITGISKEDRTRLLVFSDHSEEFGNKIAHFLGKLK